MLCTRSGATGFQSLGLISAVGPNLGFPDTLGLKIPEVLLKGRRK